MTLLIASVLLALLVSATCSLLEASLLSFTPRQVATLSQKYPRVGAIWQDFKTRIDRPIAVILILNTAAHTVGATIAGAQFEAFFQQGIILFSILFTILMLQFTEILPKTIGVRYNTLLAPIIAYPLAWLTWLMSPLLYLVQIVNRPFEPKRTPSSSAASIEEITVIAGLARLAKVINPQQERIIRGASKLSDQSVEQVMIPVAQVTFLSTAQTLTDAIVTAHLDPHTRFPICEGEDRDRVLGYVNFKEMIYHARTNPAERSLMGIIRPVHFVPPDATASELLRVFVERHEHMALVRNADGNTLGLVTLEDVIEELVGELEDEFDRLPNWVHPLSGGTWMVGGGFPIAELAKRLELELPDATGTTSSWLVRRFGRLPKTNEIYRHSNGVQFMVRRIRRGKIFEVTVSGREHSWAPSPISPNDQKGESQ